MIKNFITLLLIAGTLALIFAAARPIWNEILNLRVEVSNITETVAQLRELRDLRDELLETYNSIPVSRLERLEELLPEKPDSGAILVNLEKLIRDRGLRLRRVEFLKEQPSVPLGQPVQAQRIARRPEVVANSLTYNFTVSGSYESFRSLLLALEKSLRLVDVLDISFSGGASNAFEFTLRAKSYYR